MKTRDGHDILPGMLCYVRDGRTPAGRLVAKDRATAWRRPVEIFADSRLAETDPFREVEECSS